MSFAFLPFLSLSKFICAWKHSQHIAFVLYLRSCYTSLFHLYLFTPFPHPPLYWTKLHQTLIMRYQTVLTHMNSFYLVSDP